MAEELLGRLAGLTHWQIDLIVIGLLLQGAVVAAFPEEVIILTLGALVSQGQVAFPEAFACVLIGLLPANAAMVAAGGTIGAALLDVPPFKWFMKKDAIDRALARLNRHGTWAVVATRFTPLIRGPVYFAAGLSKIGLARFIQADAAAAAVHVSLLLLLGGVIGNSLFT